MSNTLKRIEKRNPNQPEFMQAVREIGESIDPVLEENFKLVLCRVFERIAEPDRVISFRVSWIDDGGRVRINRGWRVQMNNSLGPYKGGLRFHPTVNESVLKFLAFEQVFKNALTGLPIGGAKGGSDFDPKGKSDREIMRFCQAFMLELWRHIGHNTDVPAGDIGVGEREIGYLFGMYKKLKNEFTGVITGKGLNWGGSHLRPEATGYGLVYFAEEMMNTKGASLSKKSCLISGSGNVAQYTAEKLIDYGATVLTMSDSDGYICDLDGIDREKLDFIMKLKNVDRGRISEYVKKYYSASFIDCRRAWDIGLYADCAFPCATENELELVDANNLIKNGIRLVAEGANMPCTPEAIKAFHEAGVMFWPGKAANAGGVAVSVLQMSQNSMRYSWTREEVDAKLRKIMKHIHTQCLDAAEHYGCPDNYEAGANMAAFYKVGNAMLAQGIV